MLVISDMYVIDFETQSDVDIKLGLSSYVAGKRFSALCLGHGKLNSGEHNVWRNDAVVKDPEPTQLLDHVENGGHVIAHNAIFEYMTWESYCHRVLGWPKLKLEQLIDTRAMCAAAGIPQKLKDAAKALGFAADKQKDDRGAYLIRQCCCKPFSQDPTLLADLAEYCRQDVVVEEALYNAIPPMTRDMHDEWCRTQRINLRGVGVDLPLVRHLAKQVERRIALLDQECVALTGCKTTQVDALLEWINDRLEEHNRRAT